MRRPDQEVGETGKNSRVCIGCDVNFVEAQPDRWRNAKSSISIASMTQDKEILQCFVFISVYIGRKDYTQLVSTSPPSYKQRGISPSHPTLSRTM